MSRYDVLNEVKAELAAILDWSISARANAKEIQMRLHTRISELHISAHKEFELTLTRETPETRQAIYRRIVDGAWNECTESETVPSTDWADEIIAKVLKENKCHSK
jgi:hypothetical protein